jgi:hypothetical protein
LSDKFGFTTRFALVNILLVSNVFIWYFSAITFLDEIVSRIAQDYFTAFLIWSAHFAAVIFSAILGALFVKMNKRTDFLIFWMMLGALSSLTPMLVNNRDTSGVLAIVLTLGISLGLGMPNCMGYYAGRINVENRGRIGGIIMFISGLGIALLGMAGIENVELQTLVLVALRISGLVIFLLVRPREEIDGKSGNPSYRHIFGQRSFISYIVPWIMFSLVTYLTAPMQINIIGRTQSDSLLVVGNALMAVFAIVGGFLSDYFGRKRMAITGFALLGLGYSVLGIYPEALFSWYFYTVIDGVAWGILFVIFVVTIWGDLSFGAPSDKYYAIGVLPFFASKFLELVIGDYVARYVPSYAIFSFTAFFLFLAVLPLFYAPETLPEKRIKERELREYIEKAKKIREKHA